MVEFIVYLIASMLITSSVNAVEVDTETISQAVSEPVIVQEEEPKKEMSLAGIESEIGRISLQLTATIDAIASRKKINPDDPNIPKFEQTKIDLEEQLAELEQMKKDRELQSAE